MKTKVYIIFLLAFIMINLGGCNNEEPKSTLHDKNENTYYVLPAPPEKINLPFTPLELKELPTEMQTSKWKYMKSIQIVKESMKFTLDIYMFLPENKRYYQVNGILKYKSSQYIIQNIPSSIMENNDLPVHEFYREFPGQNRYELLFTMYSPDNSSNNQFIVYDKEQDSLKTFEGNGTPHFYDLDQDGKDEFIIEMKGYYKDDISIIHAENNELKICPSIVNSVRRTARDISTLIKNQDPPLISISNTHEQEPSYLYTYNNGILNLVNIVSNN